MARTGTGIDVTMAKVKLARGTGYRMQWTDKAGLEWRFVATSQDAAEAVQKALREDNDPWMAYAGHLTRTAARRERTEARNQRRDAGLKRWKGISAKDRKDFAKRASKARWSKPEPKGVE